MHAGFPVRVHKRRCTVRYMFHAPDDVSVAELNFKCIGFVRVHKQRMRPMLHKSVLGPSRLLVN